MIESGVDKKKKCEKVIKMSDLKISNFNLKKAHLDRKKATLTKKVRRDLKKEPKPLISLTTPSYLESISRI